MGSTKQDQKTKAINRRIKKNGKLNPVKDNEPGNLSEEIVPGSQTPPANETPPGPTDTPPDPAIRFPFGGEVESKGYNEAHVDVLTDKKASTMIEIPEAIIQRPMVDLRTSQKPAAATPAATSGGESKPATRSEHQPAATRNSTPEPSTPSADYHEQEAGGGPYMEQEAESEKEAKARAKALAEKLLHYYYAVKQMSFQLCTPNDDKLQKKIMKGKVHPMVLQMMVPMPDGRPSTVYQIIDGLVQECRVNMNIDADGKCVMPVEWHNRVLKNLTAYCQRKKWGINPEQSLAVDVAEDLMKSIGGLVGVNAAVKGFLKEATMVLRNAEKTGNISGLFAPGQWDQYASSRAPRQASQGPSPAGPTPGGPGQHEGAGDPPPGAQAPETTTPQPARRRAVRGNRKGHSVVPPAASTAGMPGAAPIPPDQIPGPASPQQEMQNAKDKDPAFNGGTKPGRKKSVIPAAVKTTEDNVPEELKGEV